MAQDDTRWGEFDLLDEIDALPDEERAEIQARAEELSRQVQALKQLREQAERSQKDVADALGIKQPSVSKIEAQADMYLSTLRAYIEALGGSLKLVVDLPHHGRIELDDLADLSNRQRGDADPYVHEKIPRRSGLNILRSSRTNPATKESQAGIGNKKESYNRGTTGSSSTKSTSRPSKS